MAAFQDDSCRSCGRCDSSPHVITFTTAALDEFRAVADKLAADLAEFARAIKRRASRPPRWTQRYEPRRVVRHIPSVRTAPPWPASVQAWHVQINRMRKGSRVTV